VPREAVLSAKTVAVIAAVGLARLRERELESGLIARGHADDDMSALARAIRGLSGLED
jgi:hypothetical protein